MKKRIIILSVAICIFSLLFCAILGGLKLVTTEKLNRDEKEKKLEEERIMLLYQKANYSVDRASNDTYYLKVYGIYQDFPLIDDEYNAYGILYDVYLSLKYYKKGTGITISYELIADYFSREYEPDGTLRLYNNGLHPEVEAFVDWMWENGGEREAYIQAIELIYRGYYYDHKDEGFEYKIFYSLSPRELDELVKKEADPEYEMDLLSLQQQGF